MTGLGQQKSDFPDVDRTRTRPPRPMRYAYGSDCQPWCTLGCGPIQIFCEVKALGRERGGGLTTASPSAPQIADGSYGPYGHIVIAGGRRARKRILVYAHQKRIDAICVNCWVKMWFPPLVRGRRVNV